MLAGQLYLANDDMLVAMRARARALFTHYNQTLNTDQATRTEILTALLGKAGQPVDIQPPFYCDYGTHIHLGENVFINYNCTILDCASITIGNNVFMGPNVSLYAATHPVVASERIKGPELAQPITIGDNVWLAGNVIVCAGVTIGANTTIGAGSVVTRDIPANVLAAGNPCRIIRSLAD
ncbi:sugar O-acetyltransferase [Spirosoma agri]|uniref:Sugar O-acetyltransferase n=2 Tax=Spirosoma agri TaxID=1987381 RepID=A0A6M0IQV9_9BACT|nr:sugar O-acetyltransferase [Spirosoma agri]